MANIDRRSLREHCHNDLYTLERSAQQNLYRSLVSYCNKVIVLDWFRTSGFLPSWIKHNTRCYHVGQFEKYYFPINLFLPNIHHINRKLQDVPGKIGWNGVINEWSLNKIKWLIKIAGKVIERHLKVHQEAFVVLAWFYLSLLLRRITRYIAASFDLSLILVGQHRESARPEHKSNRSEASQSLRLWFCRDSSIAAHASGRLRSSIYCLQLSPITN